MKKKYVVIGLVATIAIALIAQTQINAMKNWESKNIEENGSGNSLWKMIKNRWSKEMMKQEMNNFCNEEMHRNRWSKEMMKQEMNNFCNEEMHRNRWSKEMMNNYLNMTKEEGIIEYIDGKYYINGIEIYFGEDFFLNTTSRSDYDMDGTYEKVIDEINGLVGSKVIINGLLEDNIIYASHINGIWLRMPCHNEFVELQGLLEKINGSYYINGFQLMIKQGFSKSDIDRDGSIERMYDELNGLVGEEIKIDGLLKENRIVVMHINGIWAR